MCGIAGFSLKEKSIKKEIILNLMNRKLTHRGPDGEGFFHNDDISMSHKRLAIIDLNIRSNQPFVDKNNECVLVFNGEIYNYIELKKILIEDGYKFNTTGDTEVLLNSYLKWGTDLFKKIKGMFAFAIYDKKRKKIICGRDHFGQKPFFYYFKEGNFIFSSELTSLISNPTIKKEIDVKSIENYLHYDSFVGDTTPINNCFKLLPSQFLIFDIVNRTIKKERYWDLNYQFKKDYNNNYYNNFIDKLTLSTKRHLRSDVPIGLYLSGGVDSSMLAYISKNILKNENIKAFNLKFKNETFNENLMAKDTAEKIGLDLKTFNLEDIDYISELENNINEMDEPLADLGYIAVSFISKFVSMEGYKVVISGDGGDELLMGYEPFQKFWIYKILNNLPSFSKTLKYISSLMPDSNDYMGTFHKIKIFTKAFDFPKKYANSSWICSFLPGEITKLRSGTLSSSDIHDYISNIINSAESNDDYDQLLVQYQKHFLSNIICNHTDKANMRYSIEARSPFLDPELFNFTNKLPRKFKINARRSKLILRNFLKKNLKNSTFKNPKKGFTVPMAIWIKNDLKSLVLDTLSENTISRLGLFNYNYLYKEVIKPHLESNCNNHKKIWNIFILVNWLKNNKLA